MRTYKIECVNGSYEVKAASLDGAYKTIEAEDGKTIKELGGFKSIEHVIHATKTVENEYGVKVGDPVTLPVGSDRYPAVVVRVTRKTITVREVEHGANRLQWPDQDFPVYLDKPKGKEKTFKHVRGGWKCKGSWAHVGSAVYYQVSYCQFITRSEVS